jgi:ABC-type glycerol-3-phosphate transport system permease component
MKKTTLVFKEDKEMRIPLSVKHFFLYLALILIAIVTVFPLLWGFASSLRTETELFKYSMPFTAKTLIPQEPTLEAYTALFRDYGFLQPVINTFSVTIIAIFFGCIVNSVAAFAFATFKFKFKEIIYTIVLLSFMIPFESIALPLYNVVHKLGWLETYHGLIVPGVADGLVLFLFTQFFRDIPSSLIEAARVDGANWPTIFLRIIFPSSTTIFITASLMIFMNSWNSYLWPLLVGRSRNMQMVQIAIGALQGEHSSMVSSIYAGSIISALIPLILFLPFQKHFVQGMLSSGVKG